MARAKKIDFEAAKAGKIPGATMGAAGKPRTAAKPGAPINYLARRPLFMEDLTRDEQGRADARRIQVQSTMPERLAEKDGDTTNAAKAQRVVETRSESVRRMAADITHPNPAMRLQGEPGIPGAPWYAEHNRALHNIAASSGQSMERVATSSPVMSPQNSPSDELKAASAIAHAQTKGSVTMTPGLRDYLHGKNVPIRQSDSDSASPSTGGESEQIPFSELTPRAIGALSPSKMHDGTEGPGVESTGVDFAGIRRAGTNKKEGVAAMRGGTLAEHAPPASAPKVFSYGSNSYSMDATHEPIDHELNFMASDTANRAQKADQQTAYEAERAPVRDKMSPEEMKAASTGLLKKSSRGEEPTQEVDNNLPGRSDVPLDFNQLHDDNIDINPELAKHVSEKSGVTVRPGTTSLRDLHPAAVMALAHPESLDNGGTHKTQALANLSSNNPTVQDSWENGIMHGQDITGSLLKASGSNKAGYWGRKTMDDRSAIMDERPGAAQVTSAGLQHAEQDHRSRAVARHVTDSLNLPYAFPSTIVQAGGWTEARRESGSDPEFNKAKRQEPAPEQDNKPPLQHHQFSLFE